MSQTVIVNVHEENGKLVPRFPDNTSADPLRIAKTNEVEWVSQTGKGFEIKFNDRTPFAWAKKKSAKPAANRPEVVRSGRVLGNAANRYDYDLGEKGAAVGADPQIIID